MTAEETSTADRGGRRFSPVCRPSSAVRKDQIAGGRRPTVIARLAEAIGDANPLYLDLSVAEKTVHGGFVAPATMLMCRTVQAKPGRPSWQ